MGKASSPRTRPKTNVTFLNLDAGGELTWAVSTAGQAGLTPPCLPPPAPAQPRTPQPPPHAHPLGLLSGPSEGGVLLQPRLLPKPSLCSATTARLLSLWLKDLLPEGPLHTPLIPASSSVSLLSDFPISSSSSCLKFQRLTHSLFTGHLMSPPSLCRKTPQTPLKGGLYSLSTFPRWFLNPLPAGSQAKQRAPSPSPRCPCPGPPSASVPHPHPIPFSRGPGTQPLPTTGLALLLLMGLNGTTQPRRCGPVVLWSVVLQNARSPVRIPGR